jgi:hypothetical protein
VQDSLVEINGDHATRNVVVHNTNNAMVCVIVKRHRVGLIGLYRYGLYRFIRCILFFQRFMYLTLCALEIIYFGVGC